MGTDTVIVETYHLVGNHLYGKAFLKYPEDCIGEFHFRFKDDGSIANYSISYMRPDSSFLTNSGTAGVLCVGDTCEWYASWPHMTEEYRNRYATTHLDFIGGWTPTISLIQWHCMRLMKSRKARLPLVLLNDYIGLRDIEIFRGNKDTVIFGGPFLEYTRLTTDSTGRILTYDGTGTPWNFITTVHEPLDVDEYAKRLSKLPAMGIPSPRAEEKFAIKNDTITVAYSRPAKRGRVIFGGIVPYDSVWRTGANEATRFTFPYDVVIGKTKIPKGEYSIYTIPHRDDWTLIFNTDLREWPTDPNRAADFAHVSMKVRKPANAEDRLTIKIAAAKNGGEISITWDKTEAYVPFTVVGSKKKPAALK